MRSSIPFFAALGLLLALGLPADELKLKDGSKIVGTIVGFEENSFHVKTGYGFAVVQKDQVVSISIADSATPSVAPSATDVKKPVASVPANAPAKGPPTAQAAAVPSGSAAGAAPAFSYGAPATAAPATAGPSPPAAPEPVREAVIGNTYINQTYGFRMFKPPTWDILPDARTLLPGTIAALGTNDQSTYLLIGEKPAGKLLARDIDATEKRLQEAMDNFRPLGEEHVTVSGAPAIEHRFRGSVDGRDWSGVVAFITHGNQLFTIFGMTYAESDLVQIQENVIARAITSLEFTAP